MCEGSRTAQNCDDILVVYFGPSWLLFLRLYNHWRKFPSAHSLFILWYLSPFLSVSLPKLSNSRVYFDMVRHEGVFF